MSRRLFFLTHSDVVIDPEVPVTDWGLSARGRARHEIAAGASEFKGVTAIYCSAERKAVEGAEILSRPLGISHSIVDALHENDRSATGYLPKDEFETVADQFFAHPDRSIRGWETAMAAQARIVDTVGMLSAQDRTLGDIAIVAHGGVGALLLAHVMGEEISRDFDQPGGGGGNFLTLSLPELKLLEGWRDITETP